MTDYLIVFQGKTPYDLVKIDSLEDDEEVKRKKEEVMDFLKVNSLVLL